MDNKFWYCTEEVTLVVNGDDCWIFPLGTKTTFIKSVLPVGIKSEVVKEISGPFEVKVNNKLRLSILWEGKWFNICNLNKQLLASLLSESIIENGSIKNDDLEVLINKYNSGEIGFTHGDMTDYGVYFNNMCRSMAFNSGKKTKVRKAGHRYDSENKTLYCLGKVPYHRVGNEYAEVGEVALMCSCKNPKEIKTLSDLLNNIDPSDFEYEFEPEKMVDSGSIFKDDLKGNIKPHVDSLLEKSKTIKDTLAIMGLGDKTENTNTTLISDQVIDIMMRNLLSHTGDGLSQHKKINQADTKEAIISKLEIVSFPLGYEREVLYEYGIDVKKIAKKIIQNKIEISKDFDTFMKYREDYFRYRLGVGYYSSIQDSNNYIDDALKETKELNNLLRDIANRAVQNSGDGVNNFYTIKRGYRSSRYEECNFDINLQNILDTNPSEEVKMDIAKSKFNSLHIRIKKGLKVK